MKSKILQKGLIVSILTITLVGFFILGGISTAPAKASTESSTSLGEISVGGSGAVMAKPDIGIINIGVETSHKDSKSAQEENAKLSNELMEVLKKLNIEKEDIKTAHYNMYQEQHYNPQDGKSSAGDFKVNHNLEVTIRDIEQVGKVIDNATKSGANLVNSIRFTVSDTSPYYQEALKLAVKNANTKANTLADALGVKIGKPSKVTENSYSEPVIMRGMNLEYTMKEAMADTPINTGELEIRAVIQVIYNY